MEKTLEACEISRSIFRPLCEINLVRKFLVQKNPVAPPPPLYKANNHHAFCLRQNHSTANNRPLYTNRQHLPITSLYVSHTCCTATNCPFCIARRVSSV